MEGSDCHLLALSDELLLLIVQQLDRHEDVPNFWMTCKKLKSISTDYMYRNVMITLPESHPSDDPIINLVLVPDSISHIKHLTILNQCRIPGSYFHPGTVSQPHTYRILRWQLLETAGHAMNGQFGQSAFLIGRRFDWDKTKLSQDQLSSFRWRHALPLSIKHVGTILEKHGGIMTELEISMIQPPSASSVRALESTIKDKKLPKLRKLIYNGLSHTEPIPQNSPERGGRFRMLRPIFRKSHKTLDELTLTQDHCISQVGKTPLINGRTFDAFLCDMDELLINPSRSNSDYMGSVTLNLSKLELGGFKVANLFTSPSLPTISPRVRVELSSLRRLVLNDCDGLGQLLQGMQVRKDEIKLKEVAFRIVEDEEAYEDFAQLADTVKDFITSFNGLQILSVLWEGTNAPSAEDISRALSHHAETLEVYAFAAREDDDDEDMGTTLRFIAKPQGPSPWTPVLLKKKPPLREIAIQLPDTDYFTLRLLSQFDTLRTVHIRNFPPLTSPAEWWRGGDGSVWQSTQRTAAKIAESIALPFYALPKEVVEGGEQASNVAKTFKLQELADLHTTRRDESLGCVKLKSLYSTSVPVADVSRRVLEQRADIDPQFAAIMSRVKEKKAFVGEEIRYSEYLEHVQSVLGLIPPTVEPKLRLLIVGDWRYRDQMNLTGPRNWDPNAWCQEKGEDLDDNSDMDNNPSAMVDPPIDVHGGVQYRLRSGFKKEWDVSLLPIFFKIDWEAERGEDKEFRWKASTTVLDQTTLEGYGVLGDVRSLDFAFQN